MWSHKILPVNGGPLRPFEAGTAGASCTAARVDVAVLRHKRVEGSSGRTWLGLAGEWHHEDSGFGRSDAPSHAGIGSTVVAGRFAEATGHHSADGELRSGARERRGQGRCSLRLRNGA